MPIAEISPYMNKWTVKARIASRSQLRSFQRKGGGAEGKVFHVEIVDAGGGEIRASFFDKAAVGHYELLQVGKVFTFSSKGAQVKIANRQYNTTNSRYELTFDKGAEIMESSGEIAPVPVVFAFTDLRAVQALRALPCRVDVVGVVKEFRPVGTVRTKEGKELAKRDIIIADDTSSSMKVTLWNKTAEMPDSDFEGTPTIALKGVILKEWNGGRDGSLGDSSVILLNPEGLPEAARIQQWWSQGGKSQNLTPLGASGGAGGAAKNAQRVSVSEMRRNAEMVSDKPEYFTVPVRLFEVQTRKQGEQIPLHYNACAESREGSTYLCGKKVDAQGYCAICQRTGRTQVKLAVRGRFSDFGDSAWMTTFHEAAQEVLGMPGEKVAELEREQLEAALRQQYFLEPMEITVRAKMDAYDGNFRTNTCVIAAKPVDRRANGRKMLSEIQELIS